MPIGRRVIFLLASGLIAATAMAEPQDGPPAQLPSTLASILDDLREGGFIIYFRHAATVHDGGDNGAEDLARCDTQRNLSAKGRVDAVHIGQSIRVLGIPIGVVAASPYCRAKETASLAFSRFVVNEDLGFVVSANASETRHLAKSLRQMLATPPKKGRNDVIVSHSANLFEAAGIFAKPEGAAYVFRPLPGGRFEAVARVLPGEWGDAAKRQSGLPQPTKTATTR